mgnify:CR=1 FL=1
MQQPSTIWPLAYDEAGTGGRPLMLVHGYTGGRVDFDVWMEPLAEAGHHVVAPDLRGHGATGGPDDPGKYGLGSFADDLVALADQLGWGSFNLLGHSMGGMIAQHLVLERPDRVEGLVLMDTHHGPVRGIDPDLLDLAIAVATTEGMEALATAMDALGASPLETEAARRLRAERPDLVALDRAKFLASHPTMYATMGRLLVDRPDRLAHLAQVAAPTLVMVGELDGPFLAASRRMAETIPDARLVVLEGAGHSPQREAPEAWWAALDQFLESVVSSPSDGSGRRAAPGRDSRSSG